MEDSVVCLALMLMASVVYIACNHNSTLRVHGYSYLNDAADHIVSQPPLPKKVRPVSKERKRSVQVTNSANTPSEHGPGSFLDLPVKRLRDSSSPLAARIPNKGQPPSLPKLPAPKKTQSEPSVGGLASQSEALNSSKPSEVYIASTLNELNAQSAPQPFFGEGVRLPPPRIGAPQSGQRTSLLSGMSPVSIPYVLPEGFQVANPSLSTEPVQAERNASLVQLGKLTASEFSTTRLNQSQTTEEWQPPPLSLETLAHFNSPNT